MFAFRKLTLVVFTAVALAATPSITLADQRESAAKLLARTMFNPEFRPKTFRGGEWFGDGDSYLALEPSATAGGTDIVRYQTASGAREIFVPASRLIPLATRNLSPSKAIPSPPTANNSCSSRTPKPSGARTPAATIGSSISRPVLYERLVATLPHPASCSRSFPRTVPKSPTCAATTFIPKISPAKKSRN